MKKIILNSFKNLNKDKLKINFSANLYSFKITKYNLLNKKQFCIKDKSDENNNNDNNNDNINDNNTLTDKEAKEILKFADINARKNEIVQEKENTSEQEQKENTETLPLVYYINPIVPFSKTMIKNPNRNDLFFSLILKYGKLTVVDDETTIIEDVVVFSDKDERGLGYFKYNEADRNVLGVVCRITYKNKENLTIEGLNKSYLIKYSKPGKYKFFNLNEATLIEHDYVATKDNVNNALDFFDKIVKSHDFISNKLNLGLDTFNLNDIKYDFNITDIKSYLSEREALDLESKESLEKILSELNRFAFYFIQKLDTFNSISNAGFEDVNKILVQHDLNKKLEKLFNDYDSIENLLRTKYDEYKFPKNFKLNHENPFVKDTLEDKNRILKYKEIIENKMNETETIEKQKEEFRKTIKNYKSMSQETKIYLEKEISKISSSSYDSENSKRLEYLNHVVNMPWDSYDKPVWDLEHAKKVLDSNLYGLDETKDRIYELIAKNMRLDNKKGCVIMLTGGPGTGKTRIAKLIGEALHRKVGFISLAGMADGKTILGFKRTYVSSTPGAIIKEMQKVAIKNPVMVIDEIDKANLRSGYSNVYYSILQLLNPEENYRFTDHYMEIPFDLSNVIFILTSNNKEIFRPLLDRMEIINIDPYVTDEKLVILKKYSKDQILNEYGYDSKSFEITDKALYNLIHDHCQKEAGVRNAKKLLENLIRKVNSKLDKNNINLQTEQVIQINSENIQRILDEPKEEDPVLTDMIQQFNNGKPGVCIGLSVSKTNQSNSWGSGTVVSLCVKEIKKIKFQDITIDNNVELNKGIAVNNIENDLEVKDDNLDKKSKKSKNKELKFKITSSGSLGEDSLQSLNIALNLATETLQKIDPENADFFYKNEVHLDMPVVMVGKSGPSAGIVLYLIAMSTALKIPLIPFLAMTGEVGLDGSVLVIGGVKEKSQGAIRCGVKTLVLPIGNKQDFIGLPVALKNSFERVFFVSHVNQVYNIGFDLDIDGIDCYLPSKQNDEIQYGFYEEKLSQNNLLDQLF